MKCRRCRKSIMPGRDRCYDCSLILITKDRLNRSLNKCFSAKNKSKSK